MSDERLPGLLRRIPLLLAAALSAIAVWTAYYALSEGREFRDGALVVTGIVVAAAVVVELMTGGLAFVPKTLVREVFGAIGLIAVLGILLVMQEMRYFPKSVRSWEFVIGAVAAYGFFLASQQSFLIHAGLGACMFFVALLNFPRSQPSLVFAASAAFAVALAAQLAVLFHREKLEDVEPGRVLDGWLPFRASPLSLAGLVVLFALFFSIRPAEGKSLADLWRESRPAMATKLVTGSGLDRALPTDPVPDPFNPFVQPAAGPGTRGESLQVPWMSFQRDLKFGDVSTGVGHPETVIMYCQLRDHAGMKTDGGDLPVYWTTGVVARYDGRTWAGDATLGRLIEDAEDGLPDGRVTFRPPSSRVPTVTMEQRTIILPISSRSLFLAYPVLNVDVAPVMADSEGMLSRSKGNEGRFKYTASVRLPRTTPADLQKATAKHRDPRYLQVPATFSRDNDAKAAVHQVRMVAKSAWGRIQAAMQLLSQFRYTQQPGFREDADPTVEFLRARRGYCQHFSSAMTLMLRQLEIPARVAVGFTKGDWNETDEIFIVRRKHAHAWVEVFFEGIGWIPFDPAGQPLTSYSRDEDLPPTPPIEPRKPDRKLPADPVTPPDSTPPKPPDSTPPDSLPPRPPDSTPPKPPLGTPDKTPALPMPPPTGPGPSMDPGAHKTEFDRLWDAVNNRAGDATGGIEAGGPRPGGTGGGGTIESSKLGEAAGRIGGILWRVLRDLGVILVVAAILYAIVMRILRGKRRGGNRPAVALADGVVLDDAGFEVEEREARSGVPRGGRRWRLVELYLDLIRFLAGRGRGRRPNQTAYEYLEAMKPGSTGMATLTGLFVEARYGDREMTADEVARGESAHREAVADTKRSRS
jgi:transglutaminase-like putative cysteine protease